MPMVIARWRMAHRTAVRYRSIRKCIAGLCHSLVPFWKAKLASTGAIKIEKSNAPRSAKATVQAMGWKSLPSTRCRVKMGK